MLNDIIRKVNEIIDTLSLLEEFDDIAYKHLNDYIHEVEEMIVQNPNVDLTKIEERVAELERDVEYLKGLGEDNE